MAAACTRLLVGGGGACSRRSATTTRGPHCAGRSCWWRRCFYHVDGWSQAEDALRTAEALAGTDEERGAAACERGLPRLRRDAASRYATGPTRPARRFGPQRGAARARLARTGRCWTSGAGLIAENIAETRRPRGRRTGARTRGPWRTATRFLTSFTWRHLAGLAAAEGDLAEARHGFAESLRIRVSLGHLVGAAPALLSLSDVAADPEEAARLRAEAARLYDLMGGVPTWLAPSLAA